VLQLNAASALPELSPSQPALFPLIKQQKQLNSSNELAKISAKNLEKKCYINNTLNNNIG